MSILFNSFTDYWYFAKHFNEQQRTVFFNSLPVNQQTKIRDSYRTGSWEDVFKRNLIHNYLEEMKSKYGYDLLSIKLKVLHGKSVYLPKDFWEEVTDELRKYDYKHIQFVLGGIKSYPCPANNNIVLIDKTHV